MGLAAVDIGNSFIKVGHWTPSYTYRASNSSIEEAIRTCKESGAESVAYCTTRRLNREEKGMLDEAGWWELRHDANLPLQIYYTTPETLGADRLAAAIGAWKLYGGKTVLIADLGTALTLDVVTAGGKFLGGNISPGIELRVRSLHDYTSKLPLVDNIMEVEGYFGHDTRTAIMAGCGYGPVYETGGTFLVARREKGCEMVIATGGAGPLLRSRLLDIFGEDFPVVFDISLVAEGLKEAYNYNHDKKY